MNAQRSDIPDPDMEDIKREYEALRPEAEEVLTALGRDLKTVADGEVGRDHKGAGEDFPELLFQTFKKSEPEKGWRPAPYQRRSRPPYSVSFS